MLYKISSELWNDIEVFPLQGQGTEQETKRQNTSDHVFCYSVRGKCCLKKVVKRQELLLSAEKICLFWMKWPFLKLRIG